MAGSSSVAGEREPFRPNREPFPHFFKVIVHPFHAGLGIPEAFLQKYGDSLGNVATLKDPNGAEWEIELFKNYCGTWFRKGLEEFGEFYSIEKNHFLVFRYEGNSRFHVIIFDSSALEIDYPERSTLRWDDDDHETIEIHQDISTSGEISEEKKIKGRWVEINDYVQMLVGINAGRMVKNENLDLGSPFNRRRQLRQRISGEGTLTDPFQSTISCSKHVKKAAKLAVNRGASKSNNPSFSLSVVSSQVVPPYTICMPIKFARKNFGGDCKRKYEVRLPKSGKTWPVRVTVKGRRAHIHGIGWRSFAKENRLKLGEFCTFELVKRQRCFNFYRRD